MKSKEGGLALVLLAISVVVTGWFLIHSGRPLDDPGLSVWGWAADALPFLLWGIAPFGVLAWLSAGAGRKRWLIAMAALTGLASAAYVDGVLLHPDPQSGLLVVFVPLWTFAIIGLAAALFAAIDRLRARRQGVK